MKLKKTVVLIGMVLTCQSAVFANELAEAQKMSAQGASAIVEANRIAVSQSASHANEVSGGIEKARTEKMAIENGVNQAKEIKKAVDDVTIGVGITGSFTCRMVGEQKEQTYKQQATSAMVNNFIQAQVAQKTRTSKDALAERHARHKGLYCGQSEVKAGSCLFSPKMKPLQDTDFSNLMGYEAMQDDEQESALDFMRNVIDPIQNTPEVCNTALCQTLKYRELEFMSLANGIHSAFTMAIAKRTNTDTPMRTLVHAKIEQSKDMLSGDNWKVEQGTKMPDGTERQGGVTGNTIASDSLASKKVVFLGDELAQAYYQTQKSSTSAPKSSGGIYAVGDSIAYGFAETNRLNASDWNARIGAPPKEVLEKVKNSALKNSVNQGKQVYLSTGFSNNLQDMASIEKQLQYLKSINAQVTVAGVATNFYTKSTGEITTLNDKLAPLVAKYGFKYTGGFVAPKDRVHPDANFYKKVFKDMGSGVANVGSNGGNLWEYTNARTPKAVLNAVKKLNITEPTTIVLSVGYLNMSDNIERTQIIEVMENLKGLALKNKGNLNVIVLGLPDNLASENDWLRQQAVTSGFSYNGSFKSKDGKLPEKISISDIKGLTI